MSDPHVISKLFKQVMVHQEVNLEGKTLEEKITIIRDMFENMAEDHPLKANMKK